MALGGDTFHGKRGMLKALIAVAVLALCGGGYWLTLPGFQPLVGVTRVQLEGPQGRLREITQADTLAGVVAIVEQHYPRWRSTLAPASGGPLRLTFYRGEEPIRWVSFGDRTILSCANDACVAERVSVAVVRELVDLVRVPRHLVEVPALDPAT